MDATLLEVFKDWPMAALFAWFLFLSFRQRATTTASMLRMMELTMQTITACCDEEKPAEE